MSYSRFLAFLLCIFTGALNAQSLHDWDVISNVNDVTGLVYSDGNLWASSTGGAFKYNIADSSVTRYTNLDGLTSMDLNCIAMDTYGRFIFGAADGTITLYNPKTSQWMSDRKLENQHITDIYVNGDTVWVAADDGVGVYLNSADDFEFRDFYSNLPVTPGKSYQIRVFKNKLYFATDQGLLFASSDFITNNLKIIDAWSVLTGNDFLPSSDVKALHVFNDTLFVGTADGAAYLTSDGSGDLVPNWSAGVVSQINSNGSDLYFVRYVDFYKRVGPGWVRQGRNERVIQSWTIDANGKFWFGLDRAGLWKQGRQAPIALPGPASNHVGDLLRAKNGDLWMASGKLKVYFSLGFYRYNMRDWTSFRFFGDDWGRKNSTVSVFEDDNGLIWFGSWGGGITVVSDTGLTYYHSWTGPGKIEISDKNETAEIDYNSTDPFYTSCLGGAPVGIDNYTVITDFKQGPDGTIWFTNYDSGDSRFVTAIPKKADGTQDFDCSNWTYFGSNIGMNGEESQVTCLEFDDQERLWIGTFSPGKGIVVLDYNGTVNDLTDDRTYRVTKDDNLYSNTVLCMARDRDGVIWIGTDAGLNSYDGRTFFKHVGDIGPIENKINQIFVDSNNNKWFATDGGFSVLQGDKSPWDASAWVHYTTDNSGLPSPIVNSIFVDSKSGSAFIGTEAGLAILQGPYTEFRTDFSDMQSGPHPYVMDGSASSFVIRNLMPNSTVKIVNINGKLVRTLSGENGLIRGSRAFWNGTDLEGKKVPSGIYLYLIYTDGGETSSGKISVIKP